MQIVTDSGADLSLSPEERKELNIHVVPLTVTLDGKSYREGIDIEPGEFYELLAATDSLPVTSQPSSGEFAELYRKLAADDPDILSLHISSGLSGTLNAAKAGAEQVPEANITAVDALTLSAAAGWQAEAAARALKAGWSLEDALALAKKISNTCNSLYTLNELQYLIHGGRISHMKGLIASLLNIKPIIGVETVGGTYSQMGQTRTFKRAVASLVDQIEKEHPAGSALFVQVMHSYNPEGGQLLRGMIDERFDCTWRPLGPMSLVLGAHTGPSMVGVAYGPQALFDEIP